MITPQVTAGGVVEPGLAYIEQALMDFWGARCDTFDDDCPTCLAWAAFDKAANRAAHISSLVAAIQAAEAREKVLREALEPFAEAADNTDANDDYSSASIWEHPSAMDITIGDLRRARRARTALGGPDAG